MLIIMTGPGAWATPPTVQIDLPTEGATYDYGQFVTFSATASDDADGGAIATYAWSSDQDGPFVGVNTNFFQDNTLSEGDHLITLQVTDDNATPESAVATVSITIVGQPPTATITSPSNNSEYDSGQSVTLTGSATDPEDGALPGASLEWSSSLDSILGTGTTLTTSTLSDGTHTITLTATDSNGDQDTATISIKIGNFPPTAAITSPTTNSSYDNGDTVIFTGTGTDTEDGALTGASLAWSSSLDNAIGTGTTVTTDTLTTGTHVITLTATDSEGDTDEATIVVIIRNTPPTAVIDPPAGGREYESGETINLTGSATDAEDGALTGASLVWTSDIDGQIGTGVSLSISTLSDGTHTITLTATDSQGDTDTATISIKVGNFPPTAAINAPTDGSSYTTGDTIIFQGTGTDTEDGTLSGTALVWTSNIDGAIGTGATVVDNSLSNGAHVITLTVTDSNGDSSEDDIVVEVVNTPPVATITAPISGSIYDDDEQIQLVGEGSDDEDGTLSGASLVWSSNLDGLIGTGTSLLWNNASYGNHTITLTVTDSEGDKGTATVNITAGNTMPDPEIDHPNPLTDAPFYEGDVINFSGTASDKEDGTITGSGLTWSSDLDGYIYVLGSGNSFSSDKLLAGEQVITLTAKDSQGGTGTDSVTINIQERDKLSISPSGTITLNAGGTATRTIANGTEPFRVFSSNPYAATAALAGSTISITGVAAGVSTLTLTDAGNESYSTSIVVSGSSGGGTVNPPVADAGKDQAVIEGTTVQLDGTGSTPGDYPIALYQWTYSGAAITLSDANTAQPTFVAPSVSTGGAILTITLTVTDSDGNQSARDQLTVVVTDNGITSFPSGVTTFRTATNDNFGIATGSSAILTRLDTPAASTITVTTGRPRDLPYDLFDIQAIVGKNGATAIFSFYLPEPAPAGYYWFKYDDRNGWYNFDRSRMSSSGQEDGAVFNADRTIVTLYITDNGPYDDDDTLGVIRDPSGLGAPPAASTAGQDDDDSTCFIGAVSFR